LYSHRFLIDKFLWARRAYGFGEQLDYFDDRDTVGWTRLGNAEHPGAMAVILSDGAGEGSKWMNVARPNAWFDDLTGHLPERIQANADGWANFRCKAQSVSVWLQE
ncbi:MAG TPA: alpha-amylase domain-containing protein, partial [Blastocatellia bacterium]